MAGCHANYAKLALPDEIDLDTITSGEWFVSLPRQGECAGVEIRARTTVGGVSTSRLVCQMNHHPDRRQDALADAKLCVEAPRLYRDNKALRESLAAVRARLEGFRPEWSGEDSRIATEVDELLAK